MAMFDSRSASAWRDALSRPPRWLPWLAGAVAILALAIAIADVARTLAYEPEVASLDAPAAAAAYAERIAAAGWFGAAEEVAPGAGPVAESALALTLRAVFIASGGEAASAIVEGADERTDVVRVGAEVAPGVVLDEVLPDRIIVRHNGRREQLHFPASGEQPAVAATTTTTTAADEPPLTGAELSAEQKRANILRRLEELRARGAG